MEFVLQQTKARCGAISPDNGWECLRPHAHVGFHAGKGGNAVWLDVEELPHTWHHSSRDMFTEFWLQVTLQSEKRHALT